MVFGEVFSGMDLPHGSSSLSCGLDVGTGVEQI